MKLNKLYLGCICHSLDHVARLEYDPKQPDYISLDIICSNTYRFWDRLKNCYKHLFQDRDIYEANVILSNEDLIEIDDFFEEYRKDHIIWVQETQAKYRAKKDKEAVKS